MCQSMSLNCSFSTDKKLSLALAFMVSLAQNLPGSPSYQSGVRLLHPCPPVQFDEMPLRLLADRLRIAI